MVETTELGHGRNTFELKLREIIDGVAPEVWDDCALSIELLRRAGVDSYKDLLALVVDRRADVETRVAACRLLGWFRGPRAQDY